MLDEQKVMVELPISYLHDNCTQWESLCAELHLVPDCLEYGYCEPDEPVRLPLALAKRHGLCRDWRL